MTKKEAERKSRRPKNPLSPNVQKWGAQQGSAWLIRVPKRMVAFVSDQAKGVSEKKVQAKLAEAQVLDDGSKGVYLSKAELQALLSLSRRMRDHYAGKDRSANAEARMRIKRLSREPYNLDVSEKPKAEKPKAEPKPKAEKPKAEEPEKVLA